MEITIDWIKEKLIRKEYYFSNHADTERTDDNLTVADIKSAIINGRVIEEYEDTGRGSCVLVAGFSDSGIPIHGLCGEKDGWLVLITVYIPSPPKFKNIYERGK